MFTDRLTASLSGSWATGSAGPTPPCQIFAALGGDIAWFIRCSNVLKIQKDIDGYWNHLVAPGENRSDGVVQYSSQHYPRATFNYDVFNGDSHLGETQSDKVRPRIFDAFNLQFLVPRP